jgi:hypothetical protein
MQPEQRVPEETEGQIEDAIRRAYCEPIKPPVEGEDPEVVRDLARVDLITNPDRMRHLAAIQTAALEVHNAALEQVEQQSLARVERWCAEQANAEADLAREASEEDQPAYLSRISGLRSVQHYLATLTQQSQASNLSSPKDDESIEAKSCIEESPGVAPDPIPRSDKAGSRKPEDALEVGGDSSATQGGDADANARRIRRSDRPAGTEGVPLLDCNCGFGGAPHWFWQCDGDGDPADEAGAASETSRTDRAPVEKTDTASTSDAPSVPDQLGAPVEEER